MACKGPAQGEVAPGAEGRPDPVAGGKLDVQELSNLHEHQGHRQRERRVSPSKAGLCPAVVGGD